MKKIVLFLISFSGFSQPNYYYSGNKKMPLNVIRNKKNIIISALDTSGMIKNDSLHIEKIFQNYNINSVQNKNGLDVNIMAIVSTKSKDFNKKISQKSKHETPLFEGSNGKELILSEYFRVKLKSLADTALFYKYVKNTNSKIIEKSKYLPQWYTLECVAGSNTNALDLANKFYESGLFETSEPEMYGSYELTCFNDTYFNYQWNLKNNGYFYTMINGNPTNVTNGVDIKLCDAQKLSRGSSNIKVAIIDTGIELNHPDLGNIDTYSKDMTTNTSPSIVRGGHGTAVAGIIGATSDNGIGVVGIAPNVKLVSYSIDFGNPSSLVKTQQLADAINDAVAKGVDVINNSWTGDPIYQPQFMADAIQNALNNGRQGKGCIVVFGAGNDNSSIIPFPANTNDNILVVGGASPCGRKITFQEICGSLYGSGFNFGTKLDISAPADCIGSTDLQGPAGYNFYANGDYLPFNSFFNGTSAAAPHVAAVAALILSVKPQLTGKQVNDIIESTAQKTGGYTYSTTSGRTNGTWIQEMGYGLLDAYAALQAVCNETTINNQTLNNTPIKDCVINVNGSVVNSGVNAQLQHITSTELKNGFEVKLGGSLEVKTQP